MPATRGHPGRWPLLLLTALLAVVLAPRGVVGQERPAGVVLPGFPYDAGASFLAVAHEVTVGRLDLTLDGVLASPDRGAPAAGAGAHARWSFLPGSGISLLGGLATYGIGTGSAGPFQGAQATGALRLARPSVEAWLSWTLVRSRRALPNRWAQRTEAGVLWRPGTLSLGLAVSGTAFRDSTDVPWDTVYTVAGYPFTSHRRRDVEADFRYADAEASADVVLGPATLGVVVGVRAGWDRVPEEGWGRVRSSVTLPVPGLSLELSGGVRPAVPERAIARARFASVGFRWTPSSRTSTLDDAPQALARARGRMEAAPTLEVVPGADGAASILVLGNVAASSVEIMGDFTDWEPVRLGSSAPRTWSAPVTPRPGVHHYLLRLDGGDWSVPEGLPTARGDFGERTGVLVVQPAGP